MTVPGLSLLRSRRKFVAGLLFAGFLLNVLLASTPALRRQRSRRHVTAPDDRRNTLGDSGPERVPRSWQKLAGPSDTQAWSQSHTNGVLSSISKRVNFDVGKTVKEAPDGVRHSAKGDGQVQPDTRADNGSEQTGTTTKHTHLTRNAMGSVDGSLKPEGSQDPVAVVRNLQPLWNEPDLANYFMYDDGRFPQSLPVSTRPASGWAEQRFSADDLAVFGNVLRWLSTASGHCGPPAPLGSSGDNSLGSSGPEPLGGSGTDGPDNSGADTLATKPACLRPPLSLGSPERPCLAYVFGADPRAPFVRALADRPCQVHVFDHRAAWRQRRPPGGVRLHALGVGRNRHRPAGADGEVLTLDGVMAALGHQRRSLQYLQADLAGLETDMLLDQLVDAKDSHSRMFVLDRAEQLALSVHLRAHAEQELTFYRQLWRALQQLSLLGFDVVHSAPRSQLGWWTFPGVTGSVALVYDVLLVRKRKKHVDFDANMTSRRR